MAEATTVQAEELQAENLTPGLHTLPDPCYTIDIAGSDEGPDFEGGHSHYLSEADAAAAVKKMQDDWDDDDPRVLEIRQEDFHCLTAVSLCGVLFVYEGDEDQSHFVDRQNLLDCMGVWDLDGRAHWQVTQSGAVLCDSAQCRTCHPELAPDPLTVPVAQVDGQLPLGWTGPASGEQRD